jgi:hypothetical protein
MYRSFCIEITLNIDPYARLCMLILIRLCNVIETYLYKGTKKTEGTAGTTEYING